MKNFSLLLFLFQALLITAQCAEARYQLGRIHFTINEPESFIRIDNTDTDFAAIARAGTPATNHLFAAYSDKSSILGKVGGLPPSPYPYFLLQAEKTSAQYGLKGITMSGVLEMFATKLSGGTAPIQIADENFRKQIEQALQARNPGVKMQSPILIPAGVFSRSDIHVSILMAGVATYTLGGKSTTHEIVASMTVIDIGGFPLFLYVYDLFYPDSQSINKLKVLTDPLRSSITAK